MDEGSGEYIASLRERDYLRTLLEHSLDHIYFKDRQGRFLCINQRMAARLGLAAPQDAVGRYDEDFFKPEDAARARQDEERIIATGEPLVDVEEEETWPGGMKLWISSTKMPLIDQAGQVVGIFGISREITTQVKARKALTAANRKLAERVMQLKQLNREAILLKEMGEQLQRCENTREAAEVITQVLRQLFQSELGALYLLNPATNLLEKTSTWDAKGCYPSAFPVGECQVLKSGQPLLCMDGFPPPCVGTYNELDLAYVCMPLAVPGEQIGAIHLRGKTGKAHPAWAPLADAAVQHINLALANLKLRQTLREQSTLDPLTGLYNRRYFDTAAENLLAAAADGGEAVGLIFIDIDRFRETNRAHGHDGGDAVLCAITAYLRANLRKHDLACRFGGDEFVILLPDSTLEEAQACAEKLRAGVFELRVEHKGRTLGGVSASFGVSASPLCPGGVEALLACADQALYRAKDAGRNRVVCASSAD